MAPKSSLVVTGAILVLVLGLTWRFHQSARQARVSAALLTENVAGLQTRIVGVQGQIAARQRAVAALEAQFANSPRVATTPKPTPAPVPKSQDAILESDPKLRESFLRLTRANWTQGYQTMYRSLGFSQAQIDMFEDLAMTHADDMITLRAAAAAQGFPANFRDDAGLTALIKQSNEQFIATIAKEMGANVAEAVTEHSRQMGAPNFVTSDINSMIAQGAPPLTQSQTEQLGELMTSASAAYQQGGAADLDDLNWDSAIAQAATFLSPAQLQAFKAQAAFQQLTKKVKEFYAQRAKPGK